MKRHHFLSTLLPILLLYSESLCNTRLASVFSDHMVLQRNMPCPVWGWDEPGQEVTVTFASQQHRAIADAEGAWRLSLDEMPASAAPRRITVEGSSSITIENVLVGDVWICGGQSNMAFSLNKMWNGDIASLGANNPDLRFLRVPPKGTQELKKDFAGHWVETHPETGAHFSAVGYTFADHLQRIIGVPVGIIDNSWGGSAVEAWISRSSLDSDARFTEFMEDCARHEAYLQTQAAQTDFEEKLQQWKAARDLAVSESRPIPREPRPPKSWLAGNRRPANAYGGSLHPIIGYAISGVIWYQGESNASRAASYYDLFPFMIEEWRAKWAQGDFPFYWVQLPSMNAEVENPGESNWGELREAQTLAQKLPLTGQAVTIDLGEGNDIHPRDKFPVGMRLLRLALHEVYGYTNLAYRSPEYLKHDIDGSRISIEFDCFGGTIHTIDTNEVQGFAICGEDRVWHWAKARITGDTMIEVWSESVTQPIAVRYAWANNPVCNLITDKGLPVTATYTDASGDASAGVAHVIIEFIPPNTGE